jgi:hypothetical protein
LLVSNVVELRCFTSSNFVAIAQEFWVFRVVVSHGEALTEQFSKDGERS